MPNLSVLAFPTVVTVPNVPTGDPQPVSKVRGADGTSRKIEYRPDLVADGFQVRKYSVEAHVEDARRILEKADAGPGFRNNA